MLITLTIINTILVLLSLLLNIRTTFLVKRAQAIQKNTFLMNTNAQSILLKVITKAIVKTVTIMNSGDEDSKEQLKKIVEEE